MSGTIRRLIRSISSRLSRACGRAFTSRGGTSQLAKLSGLDVCGKTGTAQNPRGQDHSTFLSFAPKDNPKIAISVYVENGGFGASTALPIASLIEELYLTDTITRPLAGRDGQTEKDLLPGV